MSYEPMGRTTTQSELRERARRDAVRRSDELDVARTSLFESFRLFLLCRNRLRRDPLVPATSFRGSRKGYVFKLGGRGLGYYADFTALELEARAEALPISQLRSAPGWNDAIDIDGWDD
mmetsp:Transcript_5858/g.18345  ORF Transcript_5858/g.18345 Transcript_5858/m.18345 type:complete len:119 (-) Transcript_5858:51-407(-)